ncbi:MAG: tetratricopeptide repeat protein [Acidobacteriota bacterium]
MALGVVGLAGALTLAAFVAPNHAAAAARTYVPRDAGETVAHVPPRDPREVAERAALAASPERVELAVELARGDIQRARALSDPRYLGRAQATLRRWWGMAEPPPDVLLLRATIEQSLHDFRAARADLDQLIARRPEDAQAHLTRAVVATVTADYAAARASCDAVARLATPLVAMTCRAPLDALAGDADGAYEALARELERARRVDPALRGWALTTLAELAIQRGDEARAAEHLRFALALDPDDAYARAALADVLLEQHDPAAASQLCAGYEQIDNLLVRRAIAEHRAHGPEADALTQKMHERIAAAAERGDRVHMREEAMFELAVDTDQPRALALAKENWTVQKELADARLLAEAAADRTDAEPVIAWARATGVHDARLERALERLR